MKRKNSVLPYTNAEKAEARKLATQYGPEDRLRWIRMGILNMISIYGENEHGWIDPSFLNDLVRGYCHRWLTRNGMGTKSPTDKEIGDAIGALVKIGVLEIQKKQFRLGWVRIT